MMPVTMSAPPAVETMLREGHLLLEGAACAAVAAALERGDSPVVARLDCRLRLLEQDRVDSTHMTTHEFMFEDIDEVFELMESKEDDIIKPLIDFE